MISRAGLAIDMSFDHKPEDDVELKRIIKAGGFLTGKPSERNFSETHLSQMI